MNDASPWVQVWSVANPSWSRSTSVSPTQSRSNCPKRSSYPHPNATTRGLAWAVLPPSITHHDFAADPTTVLLSLFSPYITPGTEKRGSRAGSTQRGCCRDWGEATEDDAFEEEARKKRVAGSSSPKKQQNGSGEGSDGGGDGAVTEQPGASPDMAAKTTADATTTTETKPDAGEAK